MKMHQYIILLLCNIFILFAYSSCLEIKGTSPAYKLWNNGDVDPPKLVSIMMHGENNVSMEFNEIISKNNLSVEISNATTHAIAIDSMHVNEKTLSVYLENNTVPGTAYNMIITAYDTAGNSSLIVETLYGFNSNPPQLLINEFICEGSKKRPDKLELIALSDGNLAGVTLQEGGIAHYNQQIIFPQIFIKSGDFIVLHFKPNEEEQFQNETTSKTESTHSQSYENAWDIFSSYNKGIPNSSGILILLENPNGAVVDSVLYSNKKNDAEHEYRGFYKKTMYEAVLELEKHGAWSSVGNVIFPSDAINPTDSTATRSINRNTTLQDTNAAADWHIAPTSGSTFGKANTDEVYEK